MTLSLYVSVSDMATAIVTHYVSVSGHLSLISRPCRAFPLPKNLLLLNVLSEHCLTASPMPNLNPLEDDGLDVTGQHTDRTWFVTRRQQRKTFTQDFQLKHLLNEGA
ncbi:hypothetical protein K2173_008362 [Erythroxylum novogranatense]|uniref:Uncharacterized protein n=1 Tax=Erythroxylum novogranatense TaxID=1862640 RepID=A0AAV8TKP4_9ROSI|nr:hypothetical protein K2173_008362 [Erythroxylum novogranatense]